MSLVCVCFCFFQAEDGIRDYKVTGVQTCALPIYDKCHTYGWADTYVFLQDKVKIGYGAIWGKDKRDERDAIFECYLLKDYRTLATAYFSLLQQMSGAPFIECQSNDALLTSLLFEHSQNI